MYSGVPLADSTSSGPSKFPDRGQGFEIGPLLHRERASFPTVMRRKQLVWIALPCAIGVAWLGLTQGASRSGSRPTQVPDNDEVHQRSHDETMTRAADRRHTGKLSQPRYPITPSSSAPPGRWNGEYPADALQKADSLRPGKLRDRLLQQTVQSWATKSPEEARRWVEGRTDPVERGRLLQAIQGDLNGTGSVSSEQQTVEKLGEAVKRLDSDESQRVQVEDLTEEWARENLSAARDWVLAQSAGELRDELLSRIVLVQAKGNPADAARLLTAHISPGSIYDEAVITVAHQWSLQDRAAAAAWIEMFAAGPLRARAKGSRRRFSLSYERSRKQIVFDSKHQQTLSGLMIESHYYL